MISRSISRAISSTHGLNPFPIQSLALGFNVSRCPFPASFVGASHFPYDKSPSSSSSSPLSSRTNVRCFSQMTQIRSNTRTVPVAKMESKVDFMAQAKDFLSFVNASPTRTSWQSDPLYACSTVMPSETKLADLVASI